MNPEIKKEKDLMHAYTNQYLAFSKDLYKDDAKGLHMAFLFVGSEIIYQHGWKIFSALVSSLTEKYIDDNLKKD